MDDKYGLPQLKEEPEMAPETTFEALSADPGPVSATTPSPPSVVKLSAEDMLKAENLSLKLMNVGLQMTQMRMQMEQELHKTAKMRLELSEAFDKHRAHCLGIYGVDITKVRIDPDGTVTGPLPQKG